jgi:MoaA/NifB/PqqE/SkfB family radical SAM enzyme
MSDKIIGGIIISPSCDLNCFFCKGHLLRAGEREIKKQEIDVYKNLQDHKRNGIKMIEISGSDPIEYQKIIELIRYIKKEGFSFVQLSTHGTKLSDKNFLKKMISSGVNKIRVPLYGSNKKVHDSITRKEGSFEKLVEGIKNLIKSNQAIEIQVSSLILKQNKDDLQNIVDFVDSLGIKDFYFGIPCIPSVLEDVTNWYLPLKKLEKIIQNLYYYSLKVNKDFRFFDIPFCLFGDFNSKNICNISKPPSMGKYNQPPKIHKTEILDMPAYRVKKHFSFCKKCVAQDYCDGFFVNDIKKYGIGNIKIPKDFIVK